MFIKLKYIRASDKISFNGIPNRIKLSSPDGGFTIIEVEVTDGGFIYNGDEDISKYKYYSFVLNGEIQTESLKRSDIIGIPDEVSKVKRERQDDFEASESAVSGSEEKKIDREEFDEIMDSFIQGAKTHAMFNALKASEELVDNDLHGLCFDLDYDKYSDIYHNIVLLSGEDPPTTKQGDKIVKFKICYSDFLRALNVVNNFMPYKLGTNPSEVMVGDEIHKYDFPDGKCRNLAKDTFLSDAVKTDETMDITDLKNNASISIPTWKILFLAVMIGALNFIADIVDKLPIVGCKMAKIFYRHSNFLNNKIKDYTTIDLGIGEIDLGLGKEDADVSCCDGADQELDSVILDDIDDFQSNLNSINVGNSGTCVAASQNIMEVYKNKVTEHKPEKLAGLLFKTKVKGLRHVLAVGVIKDLDKYVPGVAALLLNDVNDDNVVGFYWKPILDKIFSDREKME